MQRVAVIVLTMFAALLSSCDSGPSNVIIGTIAQPVPIGTDAETIEIRFPDFWAAHCSQEAWLKEMERAQAATDRNWRKRYEKYSQALIAQAAKVQLDSISLSNV